MPPLAFPGDEGLIASIAAEAAGAHREGSGPATLGGARGGSGAAAAVARSGDPAPPAGMPLVVGAFVAQPNPKFAPGELETARVPSHWLARVQTVGPEPWPETRVKLMWFKETAPGSRLFRPCVRAHTRMHFL